MPLTRRAHQLRHPRHPGTLLEARVFEGYPVEAATKARATSAELYRGSLTLFNAAR